MNQNTTKVIRYAAQRSLTKSPKLSGFTAHSTPVLRIAGNLGTSEKQARRAMRLACKKLGRTVPGWAQRMVYPKFSREFVRVEGW